MEQSGHTLHHLRHGSGSNPDTVCLSVRAQLDDPKVHSNVHGPSPSVLQRFRSKLPHNVPTTWCLALCFLCMWAGSAINFESALPTPTAGGPGQHKQAHSRSLRYVTSETAHKVEFATQPTATAPASVAHAAIMTETDMPQFEHVALNQSGWLNVRPAIGHGETGETSMRAVPFQVISWYPRITYYPGFLDVQQTEHVIALAKTYLKPSDLAYRPGESIPETQEVRTSSGCFVSADMDKGGVLTQVEDKIAAVTHLPVGNGEPFNVLRYENGQHYDSHYDAFDPKEYGQQPSQRIATMLIFLQAPEEGGETVFKREGENGGNLTIADWRTCADGLGIKVTPKTGDAVLFWSVTPDAQLDPHSLHGACPVVRGQKWSMAKWIRDKPGGRKHRKSSH